MIAICRHYADHLEDIALAASLMNLDSDDDSDADSTKCHDHQPKDEKEDRSGLSMISEDLDELEKIVEDD